MPTAKEQIRKAWFYRATLCMGRPITENKGNKRMRNHAFLMLGMLTLAATTTEAQLYERRRSLGHPRLDFERILPGSDGAFYGLTTDAVVKIGKSGGDPIVLRSFSETNSAGTWLQALIEGSDGALYGVTAYK